MRQPELIPGRVVYAYDIEGPVFFQHEGEQHQAAEYYIESDFHHPDQFACQIITTKNKTIMYDGHSHGTWPTVARRLYRMHVAALRQAGSHV